MRHLDKSYPYQKPSKNRSSKDLNLILGPASVFPIYRAWSDKNLERAAKWCKNPMNVYQEELDGRRLARTQKARRVKSAKERRPDFPNNGIQAG